MSSKTLKKDACHYRFMVIWQALKFRKSSFAEVARRVWKSRAFVSYVAHGTRTNAAVAKALSRAAGLNHRELWNKEESGK